MHDHQSRHRVLLSVAERNRGAPVVLVILVVMIPLLMDLVEVPRDQFKFEKWRALRIDCSQDAFEITLRVLFLDDDRHPAELFKCAPIDCVNHLRLHLLQHQTLHFEHHLILILALSNSF